MANPTSNFGWQMPTATDLVTDLPADFEVFGQAVDTDFVDLLGGTTGQILSKTSATDLDFTWINNDQGDITGVTAGTGITVTSPTGPVPTVAINTAVTADLTTAQTLTNKKLSDSTTTIVDVTDATKAIKFDVAGTTGITGTIATAFTTAKTVTIPDTTGTVALTNGVVNNTLTTTTGDIIYASAANTPARLGIGSSAQVLTVSGGIPSWATPSTGALTLISTTSFSAVSSQIISSCFSSTYDNYLMTFDISAISSASNTDITLKLRTGSSVLTWQCSQILQNGATLTASTTADALVLQSGQTYASMSHANLVIQGPNLAVHSFVQSNWGWLASGSTHRTGQSKSNWIDTTQYTGLEVLSSSGTITGIISIYGMSK